MTCGNMRESEPWPGSIMNARGLPLPSQAWWIFVLNPPRGPPDGVILRLGPEFLVIRRLPLCCGEGWSRAGGRG
jgi:hypothetical protein